ncbi:hypothetical protein AB4Z46_13885 [Variovorax sp. M-6]|uniref:hypothetical protein n=1 Tax=Variovorax sp. M-6 TaxID=3233041 RepID=UPI003F9A1BC2
MMRMLMVLAALSLGACAPFHKQLTQEDRARIQEVDVRVVVAQESFMFSAQSPGVSAAAGGGLIPALIDASVQQSRQKAMAGEIQATVGPLLDYDFRVEAGRAVKALNHEAMPLKVRSVEVLAGMPTKAEHEARIAATRSGPAYMVLLLHYAIEPGLSAFTTRTTVSLWQEGRTEQSYRAAAIYQAPLEGGQRTDVIKRLTADDGKVLRGLMRESVTESLRMVALDIGPAGKANAGTAVPAPPAATPASKSVKFNFNGAWMPLTGASIEDEAARTVLRDPAGALYSLRSSAQ